MWQDNGKERFDMLEEIARYNECWNDLHGKAVLQPFKGKMLTLVTVEVTVKVVVLSNKTSYSPTTLKEKEKNKSS